MGAWNSFSMLGIRSQLKYPVSTRCLRYITQSPCPFCHGVLPRLLSGRSRCWWTAPHIELSPTLRTNCNSSLGATIHSHSHNKHIADSMMSASEHETRTESLSSHCLVTKIIGRSRVFNYGWTLDDTIWAVIIASTTNLSSRLLSKHTA